MTIRGNETVEQGQPAFLPRPTLLNNMELSLPDAGSDPRAFLRRF